MTTFVSAQEWVTDFLKKPINKTITGFLCEGENDIVRIGEPIAYLGMFGTMNWIIEERLSENHAKQLKPFINRIKALRKSLDPDYYYNNYLRADSDDCKEVPTILVSMKVKMRLKKWLRRSDKSVYSSPHSIYKIYSAKLINAELLSETWLKAWRRLDQSLREIVAISLKEPTEEKREKLARAIEKGSKALNIMYNQKVSKRFRDLVHKIEPKAEAVRTFQKDKMDWWGRLFEKFINILRIKPETPIPAYKLKREEIGKSPSRPGADKINPSIKELGIVVSIADDNLLAEKMVFSGLLVKKVLSKGKEIGLRPGDFIPYYNKSIDNVVMRLSYGKKFWIYHIVRDARYKKELKIIRNNKLITIRLNK